MDFSKIIRIRKSIRKFKPDKVPMDVIQTILNAARKAPTWANMQGVRYIVVTITELVQKLADAIGQKWAKSAPMFIVATNAENRSGKNKNGLPYYMLDVGICFDHLLLAATDEGLGTCWVGYFDEKRVKDLLEIPENERVIAITPIGYPEEGYAPKNTTRKPLNEIARVNDWNTSFEPKK